MALTTNLVEQKMLLRTKMPLVDFHRVKEPVFGGARLAVNGNYVNICSVGFGFASQTLNVCFQHVCFKQ